MPFADTSRLWRRRPSRSQINLKRAFKKKHAETAHILRVRKMLHRQRTPPEPGALLVQPRPQPDPECPWQLLRLRQKILYDDVVRARQQLIATRGDKRRIAHLEQATRAQARAVCALSKVIYPTQASLIRFPGRPLQG